MSLIEVLFALMLATITILTLALYVGNIHRAAREGKSQASASMLARTTLERLRAEPAYFQQAAPGPLEFQQQEQLHAEEVERSPMAFAVTAQATLLARETYDVTVTVGWTEEDRERSVVLESYFPRP